jgi:hypothetical protein
MGKNASEQQAKKLVGVMVEHSSLFTLGESEHIQWAIQNPTSAISLFVMALKHRAQDAVKVVKKVLTPFMAIRIGGTTKDKLIADIKANKNEDGVADEVSNYAESMMANPAFTISKERGLVNLVRLTIAELGFIIEPKTIDFMTEEFCARWSKENLDGYVIELCHPEDGPQLRKYWLGQQNDTTVWITMERITDSSGGLCVWSVERHSSGKRWLNSYLAGPYRFWSLDSVFVFRFRKII